MVTLQKWDRMDLLSIRMLTSYPRIYLVMVKILKYNSRHSANTSGPGNRLPRIEMKVELLQDLRVRPE